MIAAKAVLRMSTPNAVWYKANQKHADRAVRNGLRVSMQEDPCKACNAQSIAPRRGRIPPRALPGRM